MYTPVQLQPIVSTNARPASIQIIPVNKRYCWQQKTELSTGVPKTKRWCTGVYGRFTRNLERRIYALDCNSRIRLVCTDLKVVLKYYKVQINGTNDSSLETCKKVIWAAGFDLAAFGFQVRRSANWANLGDGWRTKFPHQLLTSFIPNGIHPFTPHSLADSTTGHFKRSLTLSKPGF